MQAASYFGICLCFFGDTVTRSTPLEEKDCWGETSGFGEQLSVWNGQTGAWRRGDELFSHRVLLQEEVNCKYTYMCIFCDVSFLVRQLGDDFNLEFLF